MTRTAKKSQVVAPKRPDLAGDTPPVALDKDAFFALIQERLRGSFWSDAEVDDADVACRFVARRWVAMELLWCDDQRPSLIPRVDPQEPRDVPSAADPYWALVDWLDARRGEAISKGPDVLDSEVWTRVNVALERVAARLQEHLKMSASSSGWQEVDSSASAFAWIAAVRSLSFVTDPAPARPLAAPQLIAEIKVIGELKSSEAAAVIGARQSTIRSWANGTRKPNPASLKRLVAVHEVLVRVARLVRAEAISSWIRRPLPSLDDRTILETLAEGDFASVFAVLEGLEHPGAS